MLTISVSYVRKLSRLTHLAPVGLTFPYPHLAHDTRLRLLRRALHDGNLRDPEIVAYGAAEESRLATIGRAYPPAKQGEPLQNRLLEKTWRVALDRSRERGVRERRGQEGALVSGEGDRGLAQGSGRSHGEQLGGGKERGESTEETRDEGVKVRLTMNWRSAQPDNSGNFGGSTNAERIDN